MAPALPPGDRCRSQMGSHMTAGKRKTAPGKGGQSQSSHINQPSKHSVLPHSTEAEESVLGAMLCSGRAIEDARDLIGPEDYYSANHGSIHNAIVSLADRREGVDCVTVAAELERSGLLDRIGGSGALVALMAGAPTTTNAAHYARIVAGFAERRQLIMAADTLAQAARDGDDDAKVSALAILDRHRAAEPSTILDQLRANSYAGEAIRAIADPPALVPGWLQRGGLGMVFGAPKTFKSYITLDLGLRLSAGMAWAGRPLPESRVLYLALEGGAVNRQRVEVWARHHNCSIPESFTMFCGRLALNLLENVSALTKYLVEISADMVIVDTVARAIPGTDENSARDIGGFVAALDQIREDTGAACLLVHHAGKDGTRGARGSNAFFGAVDLEAECIRDLGGVVVKTTATKGYAEPEPMRFGQTVVVEPTFANLVFDYLGTVDIRGQALADEGAALVDVS